MPDFTNKHTENNDYRKKGLELSEAFALSEGRRPRILVGKALATLDGSMNKICNTLADMGFDVDIAPKLKEIKKIATQSIENDSDVILIYSDQCVSYTELLDLENRILPNQPEIMMSLLVIDPNCSSTLRKQLNQWMIFDTKDNEYTMGYHILSHLLSNS